MRYFRIFIMGTAILLSLLWCSQPVFAQRFNIGTYNLRYANHGDSVHGNGWGQRLPVIAAQIRFHDFDIFGTQEGLYHMLEGLQDSLPGYAYVGIGRDDGKHTGEHSAIFYKTGKFKLLEHGDFWLSDTTDRQRCRRVHLSSLPATSMWIRPARAIS